MAGGLHGSLDVVPSAPAGWSGAQLRLQLAPSIPSCARVQVLRLAYRAVPGRWVAVPAGRGYRLLQHGADPVMPGLVPPLGTLEPRASPRALSTR